MPQLFYQSSPENIVQKASMKINFVKNFKPISYQTITDHVVYTEIHRNLRNIKNVGHTIGDYVFAVFNGLLNWNLTQFRVKIYTNNLDKVFPFGLLTTEKIEIRPVGPRCFNYFLAGWQNMGYAAADYQTNVGARLRQFRNHAYKTLGVPMPSTPPRYLLLVQKTLSQSRHKSIIDNYDGVYNALKKRFYVKRVEWAKMTLDAQLELIADAHTIITLPGSDAMNAIFMPDGGTLVMPCRRVAGMWEGSNEYRLWFRKIHWLSTIVFPPENAANVKKNTYTLSPELLLRQIKIAKTKSIPINPTICF